jgi:hypothetical protein
MPTQMDAVISSSLMTQNTIRTTFIVDIATPTPRRFTNYPSPAGLTVGSILGTLTITGAGSGFTSAPAVSFSGGGGQGAAAIAIISGGAVTALRITSRGWGYSSAPTVAIAGGGGTGATATATIGVNFPYAACSFAAIAETLDGSSVLSGNLTIVNAANTATDLVTNSANGYAPVSIQRVWRDSSDNVSGTEIWLEGFTGQTRFVGENVIIVCSADVGRRGKTPKKQWNEVLLTHAPLPASTQIAFLPDVPFFTGF